ncbi:MAG: bifunctional UDP-N-acetylglucosamine diphosphorylase/glucosamine-1-phosphate N-acetyltransferase GlmU [Actinobacteria bacterium]|nr:bifunctional UDP-N-acetylglucosamine diphosphorylase/glucosamine-1-phosphate N-acetyltransferase GlmU [Actinomycetota bacterium]
MQFSPAEEARRRLAVVVLAAGLGTRMKSKRPKVLHDVCGRPMIAWVGDAAGALSPDRMLIVLAPQAADDVHQVLSQNVEVAIQERQLGTGDAVRAAKRPLEGFDGDILVMYGDTPLITSEELQGLLQAHRAHGPACTLMTVVVGDPFNYGRVCRDADSRVTRIVEDRDASEEEKKICEINAGVYIFESGALWEALSDVGSENAQGEIYLTDVIGILASRGQAVMAHEVADPAVTIGVNSRGELAEAAGMMRARILDHHMRQGVTVIDPASTYVDAEVKIGRDTVLEPMTVLAGTTQIGEDCVIGPSSRVVDAVIDDGVTLVSSYVFQAEIGSGCTIGPFAYLRPGARILPGAKAGTFVEIKNAVVHEGSKVPHLSYIGDAEIGAGTNIGAGNITANYDGRSKSRTVIGASVHTGADTVFVAPVSIGDGAVTGAGSVITRDVPPGALGISRPEQRNIEGYARKKFAPKEENE